MRALCSWYALCPHDADGCVSHPVLGWVPCCVRCADHLDLDLVEGEVEVETEAYQPPLELGEAGHTYQEDRR